MVEQSITLRPEIGPAVAGGASDRLLDWLEPDGSRPLQNAYDERGRVTRTVDALGNATQLLYDDANRRQVITNARGAATEYRYDAAGRVTQVADAQGNV